MTQEVRPLFIWGDPDMTKLKAAKDALAIPYLLKRTPARPGTPGIEGRVLAFGEAPPFACDSYALIRTDSGYVDALRHVLYLTNDRRATNLSVWLEQNMSGGRVREV